MGKGKPQKNDKARMKPKKVGSKVKVKPTGLSIGDSAVAGY